MKDNKYIVFKRDEWDDFFNQGEWISKVNPRPLDDAVVIRTQDVFAAPALDLYSNSIQASLMILSKYSNRDDINWDELRQLREICDYFHEAAVEAWERQDKKLPD